MINAIERTEEVSLLSLGIQGITSERRNSEVFGGGIPRTRRSVFLQYEFHAKLGIDGAKVKVSKTGANAYLVSIPKFISIGYDEPKFQVATESGGLLKFVTSDIDKVGMINKVLSSKAKKRYIASNLDILKEQAQTFYERLITSIDPDAATNFEFEEQS